MCQRKGGLADSTESDSKGDLLPLYWVCQGKGDLLILLDVIVKGIYCHCTGCVRLNGIY